MGPMKLVPAAATVAAVLSLGACGSGDGPENGADAILADGTAWSHSSGFGFRRPAGWQIEEGSQGLRLRPPDRLPDDDPLGEVYLINGQDAGGVGSPSDPALLRGFDEQVSATLPFVKRLGAGTALDAGRHPAAVLDWESAADGVGAVRCRLYVVLFGRFEWHLLALGAPERVERRDAALREIVATFHVKDRAAADDSGSGSGAGGSRDPRLVGTWVYSHVYMSGSFSGSYEEVRTLQPDGSWSSSSGAGAGMSHLGSDGSFEGSSSARAEGAGASGRWSTSGDTLTFVHPDGSEETVGFYVEGEPGARRMLLKSPGGGRRLWTQRG